MIRAPNFAAKLRLALSALAYSRGKLAAEVGVDKSLVGRWASGTVRPTEHNLSRITTIVANRITGFNMLDWDREPPDFAVRLGLEPNAAGFEPMLTANDGGAALALPFVEHALRPTGLRGTAYQGFWRTSRPSLLMSDHMFQDHGMIRMHGNGLLQVRMGAAGLTFNGWMFLSEGNVFTMLHDTNGQTPLFLIFRGVPLPRADLLEGILLMAALNPARTPAAVPILLERIGNLTGDADADEKTYEDLIQRDPRVPISEVTEEIRAFLLRDVGPEAAKHGGPLFLCATGLTSLTRGSTASGQLTG